MDAEHKKILKALSLELRHLLEGWYDNAGRWHAGDLEQRLNALGVWRDRKPVPADELAHLAPVDREARRVADAYLKLREEAEVERGEAVAEFVRETAYTWANRLLALRCMEARGLIDEVILQKPVYGGRSLEHHRLAQRQPELCLGEDGGLFATLDQAFERQAEHLPLLFDPRAPGVALQPSVPAIKQAVALLSGTEAVKGQDPATDEVFCAPDAVGWAYQYWNTEEKDRVFETARTRRGAKIEGADIIPATQLYTEPYMVKFLVQNSLGALWMGMHPESRLCDKWAYYVRDAERAPVGRKPVREITFLDPAVGSGHFPLEAFDLFYDMYLEEGEVTEPEAICASILENNLFGIDIDERAVQIAEAALWMRAAERAFGFKGVPANLVATNIRLPKGQDHLRAFLAKYPEDRDLRPALEVIFDGLQHADELGSLLQIEELVEKELRYLQARYEESRGRPEQMVMFDELRQPRQGELPFGLESYEEWKGQTLTRLGEHFAFDANAGDLGQFFFGRSAGQGLVLFDLLAKRYDIVATNPPYMGLKNMGGVVSAYVERQYKPGKGDLYGAFLLRCRELASQGGFVAMITRKIWMFLKTFCDLREVVTQASTIETICDLGSRAFDPENKLHDGVDCALFTLSNTPPANDTALIAIRVSAYPGPEQKSKHILQALESPDAADIFRVLQSAFGRIDGSPFAYWISGNLLDLVSSNETIGDRVKFGEGLGTRHDARFVRMWWECLRFGVRWFRFVKGGGYCKWWGLNYFSVDYAHRGAAIKNSIIEKYPYLKGNYGWLVRNEELYFSCGLTFTDMSARSLGVRLLPDQAIFTDKGPGIIPEETDIYFIASYLNSRPVTYGLRCLTPTLQFRSGYIQKIAWPSVAPSIHAKTSRIASAAVSLKQRLLSMDPVEFYFEPNVISPRLSSLCTAIQAIRQASLAISALLHSVEGLNEQLWCDSLNLEPEDKANLVDETGNPVGWLPLVQNYGAEIEASEAYGLESEQAQTVESLQSQQLAMVEEQSLNEHELKSLRCLLGYAFQAGPGAQIESLELDLDSTADEEESSGAATVPIPSETFLEELSRKVWFHPVSVYHLLREGIERESWRCPPEEQRITSDRFTVIVLHLLGHRWPKQIEAGEPVPNWADVDGIIPLTKATDEPTLLDRVRQRIAAEFPGGDVTAIEREFAEIMGKPLDLWLTTEFFKHHSSQFKKRPIAWQIQSGRFTTRQQPAFACLVYYHKLSGATLATIQSQYVRPLRQRYATELRGLEGIAREARSAKQDARRAELQEAIQELSEFDAALEQVAREGFSSTALEKIVEQEPLDRWCSIDGIKPAPESREVLLHQEQGYTPDLNDGVRVNIAPLQKAGLLAANVLSAKDVDQAIADRAEWRADERRWCREGKLPKPGWWGP